jgi:RNA polymerase sigma-70 factor (ECF subfamily)
MAADEHELLSLIKACVRGEQKAWHLFVGEYGIIVRGCLAGYFRGRTERVDDVTQQVFIKLWKAGLKDFRGTSRFQFLSYLKLITINEARTYLRSKIRETSEVSIDQDPLSGHEVKAFAEIASEAPGPERSAIARESIEILASHLGALSLEHQQIFLLKAKGYTDRETAEILGIPDGTVASGYSRILDKLRQGFQSD